jgi:poly-gamma-glutamate capsule biosynthesis protein CapA/YwtB (metallophosphatase superfamily)
VAALPPASTTSSSTTAGSSAAPTSTVALTVVPPAPPASNEPTVPAEPVRLLFTGDVLMHSPLWRQAERNGDGVHDFVPMFAGVRPLVETADLAVCHLETPIAPAFEPYSTHPRYGVPAEVVDALAEVGFDHCSTASNHTFDRGVGGVDATAARFEADGITQHGMARSPEEIEPELLQVGEYVIGHISATYGFDEGRRPDDEPWRSNLIDPAQLIADAQLARARGADLVVVSLHWGSSMSHRASDSQRAIAEELAASGVIDLVVGHHAHVVQPIEQIGSMWVAYGLGNFISNMPIEGSEFASEDTRDGAMLEVVVGTDDVDPAVHVLSVVARPIWVDRDAGWVVRDVLTSLRDPEMAARIGTALDDSWRRTASVVGPYLPLV